jgi:uncharacterized protein
MFDFYVEEGIDQVCFNVEESEGDHVSRSFAEIGVETAYYRFLREFWQLSAAAPGKISFIREIEHAIQQVIRPADAPFTNQLVEPFVITSMDWAGNISTFSPELLGLKNPAYQDFLLGNINRDTLVDMPQRSNFARMLADIRAGVEMCRESCEYFSVCGGGEPVNKLAENGSFASTETTYCRLTKMQATDLVLDALERLPLKRRAGKPFLAPRFADELSRFGGQDEQHVPPFGRVRHCRRDAVVAGRARSRAGQPSAVDRRRAVAPIRCTRLHTIGGPRHRS